MWALFELFLNQHYTLYIAGIISRWRLGLQADAHELLIGILNSGSAAAATVDDLVQFNMVTEGITSSECHVDCSCVLPCLYMFIIYNSLVTCNSCQNISKATFQCNHLNIPVYPIQVWTNTHCTASLSLHPCELCRFLILHLPKLLWNN